MRQVLKVIEQSLQVLKLIEQSLRFLFINVSRDWPKFRTIYILHHYVNIEIT